jgi:Fanconi anemia group M protein
VKDLKFDGYLIKGMAEEDQTRIIDEFKEGDFKVLVATSVGMEGLDVPDCNMTLNYNFNANEITKIQMSGKKLFIKVFIHQRPI